MTTMHRIFVATNNTHKLRELRALLGPGIDLQPARAVNPNLDWDECGETFRENALIKARALQQYAPKSACILADDSGLEVEALGKAPGVHSAYFAGVHGDHQANSDKLLAAMRDLPRDKRDARFVCVLCFIDQHATAHFFEGTCTGAIADTPRGGGGFGYDPIFLVQAAGYRHMAELTESEKNAVSHRAHAVQAWQRAMPDLF